MTVMADAAVLAKAMNDVTVAKARAAAVRAAMPAEVLAAAEARVAEVNAWLRATWKVAA